MADPAQEDEHKNDAKAPPPTKGGWIEEHAFGSAMQFIRQVEHLLAVHNGNVPEEEKVALKSAWRRLGPLDTAVVQQKLGSKLNSAMN